MFSEAARAAGLGIEVVVPCADYEATFKAPDTLARYRDLLAVASQVVKLDYPIPSEDAFLAAGKRVVELSTLVVSLWNGKPAAGKGGTGDIVEFARKLGRVVVDINPNTMKVARLDPHPEGR